MWSKRTNIIDEISAQLARIENIDSGCGSGNTYGEITENMKTNRDHARGLLDQIEDMLPSGSGIDNGTKINRDESTPLKIVLDVSYHHMNDVGMYDGWTEHKIIVTPTFGSFDMRITGRNRNDIKDYLADVYTSAISEAIDVWADGSITTCWYELANYHFTTPKLIFDPIHAGM